MTTSSGSEVPVMGSANSITKSLSGGLAGVPVGGVTTGEVTGDTPLTKMSPTPKPKKTTLFGSLSMTTRLLIS